MNEAKFWRLRQLILDSTRFIKNGIEFDTYLAFEKGYSTDEITIADNILTNSSYYTDEFSAEIREINGDSAFNLVIYFVEFAKIIFILDRNHPKSTYIFEEDLKKAVTLKSFVAICDSYIGQWFYTDPCDKQQ